MNRVILRLGVVSGLSLVQCATNDVAPPVVDGGSPSDEDGGAFLGEDAEAAAPTGCKPGADVNLDQDGDGYTVAQGDCDDCDPNANPGAFDLPGNARDEDCSGRPDDEPGACDADLTLADDDAMEVSKALGLCRRTTAEAQGKERTWGVLSAQFVKPSRKPETFPLSHGTLSQLGVNLPLEGAHMLALSTGFAREPGTKVGELPSTRYCKDVTQESDVPFFLGGCDKDYVSTVPGLFPRESPSCPGIYTGVPRDGAGYLITLRVPTNAHSFTYRQNFFTFEFPDYICTGFNDIYVVTIDPSSDVDNNIAFDDKGNTIGVNSGFFRACTPQSAGGKSFPCELGTDSLVETGFEGHGATGWLTTTSPVERGAVVTLFFAIWDSGDGDYDSTVLIDDFRWSVDPARRAFTEPTRLKRRGATRTARGES